jgi:hypothetical protein
MINSFFFNFQEFPKLSALFAGSSAAGVGGRAVHRVFLSFREPKRANTNAFSAPGTSRNAVVSKPRALTLFPLLRARSWLVSRGRLRGQKTVFRAPPPKNSFLAETIDAHRRQTSRALPFAHPLGLAMFSASALSAEPAPQITFMVAS